jgi:hypothetical protein
MLELETRRFWMELVGSQEARMSVQDLEGYDELMGKVFATLPPEQRDKVLDTVPPEQVLSHYAPEQRVAGLTPEQRLAGLDRDHQALALPVEMIRALSESYLQSLSPEVQAELRRRIQGS